MSIHLQRFYKIFISDLQSLYTSEMQHQYPIPLFAHNYVKEVCATHIKGIIIIITVNNINIMIMILIIIISSLSVPPIPSSITELSDQDFSFVSGTES